MYQFLFLREWRPNLSVISAAFIALGKSYKQRKKRISQSARYTCDSRKRKAQQVWHLQYGLLKVASDQYFGGFNTKSTNPIKMKCIFCEKLWTFWDKFVDNWTDCFYFFGPIFMTFWAYFMTLWISIFFRTDLLIFIDFLEKFVGLLHIFFFTFGTNLICFWTQNQSDKSVDYLCQLLLTGLTCLLAKMRSTASLSSSSASIRISSSRASPIRSRSFESTTKMRPWVFWK